MLKYGFKIKTRGGMIVDNLMVAGRDRAEAEHKLNQIYHNCEILECQEAKQLVTRDEAMDIETVFALIGRQGEK